MTSRPTLETSTDLELRIIAAIRRLMRAVDLHSRRLVGEHGLTGPQLATLQELARSGVTQPSSLARAVHLSGATMTGILNRLEKRGFVRRSRGESDRRTVLVEITDEGNALLDRAPSLLQDRFRDRLAMLEDWEQMTMLANLQRIASMMDAEGLDAAPHLVTDGRDLGPPPGDPTAGDPTDPESPAPVSLPAFSSPQRSDRT